MAISDSLCMPLGSVVGVRLRLGQQYHLDVVLDAVGGRSLKRGRGWGLAAQDLQGELDTRAADGGWVVNRDALEAVVLGILVE